MQSKHKGGHMIDIIFTLALFCVFAASALFVVLIGASVYKNTTASMSDNFDARTSIAYITAKIRQNDLADSVFLTELGGNSALVLTREIEGYRYKTWIYHYNGELMEIFAAEDSDVSPESGQPIMKAPYLEMEDLEDGMLRFSTVDGAGRDVSVIINPRCLQNAEGGA